MDWNSAVASMRDGHSVRRKSEAYRRQLSDDVVETGREGCRLMHAWTADETPALVFMGSLSRQLFVPDDEDRSATDWEIDHA